MKWNVMELDYWIYMLIWCISLTVQASSKLPDFSDFTFTIEPSDVIATKGQPTTLNCDVSYKGQTTPVIKWIKDGVELDLVGDRRRSLLSNGSLHISEVTHSRSLSDNGIYRCISTLANVGVIVSRKAKLEVAYVSRNFPIEPQDLSIYLLDTAMFQCKSDGIPSPNITWFKDNSRLPDKTNLKVYPEGVLEISSVDFSDFGTYHCKAENVNLEKTRSSRRATLQQDPNVDKVHQGIQPYFVLRPRDTQAVEGTKVILFCGANGQDRQGRQPTITWLKAGQTINFVDTQGRLAITGRGSLQIFNVQESDSGTYTCRAENTEDSVDADATLSVFVAPRFIREPQNVRAHEKSVVELQCDVYGVPKPKIRWMKDGMLIEEKDYLQIVDNKHLQVLGLLDIDEGIYQCFAENTLGNIQGEAQLIVVPEDVPLPTTPSSISRLPYLGGSYGDRQHLPTQPKDLLPAIVSKRFVTLSWKEPERPGPGGIIAYSLFWKEKGSVRERVMNTTTLEANIQHLKPNTEYEFRIRAYNSYGPSPTFAQSVITTDRDVDVPSPAVNLRATTMSPESILVQWDPPRYPKGQIVKYLIIYYEVGANGEHRVESMELSYLLTGLQKFREFSFRVVAYNQNGEGMSTEEFVARTFSTRPDGPPQNFTLETASSTSIIVRWEPPELDLQNGVITGYKIRYRKREPKGGSTVTTDGNRRVYALTDLKKDTEYQVRISALTVNGSGPATPWRRETTYRDDLDESVVPPPPRRIRVTSYHDSIRVSWSAPPPESKIMVRGYTLGYGKGVSDVYQISLDADEHVYLIEDLEPASEYVITVRAFNNRGDGQPRYQTAVTSEQSELEPNPTPMMPPVGLKAMVLSATTVVLIWTDTSLGQSQRITDTRYYTVRYRPYGNNRRYKFLNSTDLNAHIDNLKPYTKYEFSVMVIKGRRLSTWSLSELNTTKESAPGSMPRDLTPVGMEGNPTAVTLNWQPPSKPNGLITGYLVFYTTDNSKPDFDWVVEGVLGDELSKTISGLTADTTYFFKVQARNNQGYGPVSPTKIFKTPKVDGTGGGQVNPRFSPELPEGQVPDNTAGTPAPRSNNGSSNEGGISTNVLIIIIACIVGAAFCIGIVVVAIVLCRRRDPNHGKRQPTGSPVKGKPSPRELKPPDLWIHDHQFEMKSLDKPDRSESSLTMSTLRRNSHDAKSMDELQPLDSEKYIPDYDREGMFPPARQHMPGSDHECMFPSRQHTPAGLIRPKPTKPLTISVETQPAPREPIAMVTALPNGGLVQSMDPHSGIPHSRPGFPRTQYNMQYTTAPRVNAGDVPQPSPKHRHQSLDEEEVGIKEPVDQPFPRRIGYGCKSCSHGNIDQMGEIPFYKTQPTAVVTPDKKAPPPEYKSVAPTSPPPPEYKSLPRTIHPLKSFSVPSPPSQGIPVGVIHRTPKKHHIVKPQQSPYKKPTPPISSVPIKPRTAMPPIPKAPDVILKPGKEDPDLQKSVSTEELTAEMANLDCLMKDLNAITQQDFEC